MINQPFTLSKDLQKRLLVCQGSVADHFIYVSVQQQKLFLVTDFTIKAFFSVSTSRYGIGNQENSLKTPPGIHRIIEKYGANAPIGRIFKDREDSGRNWYPGMDEQNLILTRILRLEGIEPGVNKGSGIDSYERYIYIHGTNNEACIGTPHSHGCVCMKNDEVVTLFDMVKEGTIVIID